MVNSIGEQEYNTLAAFIGIDNLHINSESIAMTLREQNAEASQLGILGFPQLLDTAWSVIWNQKYGDHIQGSFEVDFIAL